VPILQRETESWPEEAYVEYANPTGTGRAIRTGQWKFAVQTNGRLPGECACAEEYTEAFLYDLEADPWEQDNCIELEGYRGVVDQLRERLLRRIEAVEGRRPRILLPENIRPSGQRTLPADLGLR
ncbi:MAG: sulfatase-like hydrolase/transferase, partial [Puniceicoccales bacterium]